MADLPYLAHRLYNRPQLATPDYAALVSSLLAERMGVAAPLDLAASEKPPERRPFSASLTDGVLTYPIVGGLVHRGDAVAGAQPAPGPVGVAEQHERLACVVDAHAQVGAAHPRSGL